MSIRYPAERNIPIAHRHLAGGLDLDRGFEPGRSEPNARCRAPRAGRMLHDPPKGRDTDMVTTSARRVVGHTSEDVNERIRRETDRRIAWFADHPGGIDARLRELDEEWDIERVLETGSSALTLAGLVLGVGVSASGCSCRWRCRASSCSTRCRGGAPRCPCSAGSASARSPRSSANATRSRRCAATRLRLNPRGDDRRHDDIEFAVALIGD
jgi:hypothetical protein